MKIPSGRLWDITFMRRASTCDHSKRWPPASSQFMLSPSELVPYLMKFHQVVHETSRTWESNGGMYWHLENMPQLSAVQRHNQRKKKILLQQWKFLQWKSHEEGINCTAYLQIVLKVAESSRWVPGVQVIQILSIRLLLFPQQVFSCHLIIPGRPSWETKTWQWIIKFQRVNQWPTPLTYSTHLLGLFWDCHVDSIKKQPDLSLRGRCHWCWSQVLCPRRAAALSPGPISFSFPHPLCSLSQSAVGTWGEECEEDVNETTLILSEHWVAIFEKCYLNHV